MSKSLKVSYSCFSLSESWYLAPEGPVFEDGPAVMVRVKLLNVEREEESRLSDDD